MPNFPGMNPYLEGYLFSDLHNALASRIRALLTLLLRPRYAARLEVSTVQDTSLSEELWIIYPDGVNEKKGGQAGEGCLYQKSRQRLERLR